MNAVVITSSPFFIPIAINDISNASVPLDVVIQCLNQIWDIHPIIPIVKASGGIISTWKNEDAVKAGNIIVSNNINNHKKILKLLRPALK